MIIEVYSVQLEILKYYWSGMVKLIFDHLTFPDYYNKHRSVMVKVN